MLFLQTTGLSGAGKSTLTQAVCQKLSVLGYASMVIDGDAYRKTLCSDLGFSHADRMENVRRLGKLAFQHMKEGNVVFLAVINPFQKVRDELQNNYGAKTIWIDCQLETLICRDTKGLYEKAFLPDGHPQKLNNLTGVNDVYEKPSNPDLYIDTHRYNVEESVQRVLEFILDLLGQASKPQAPDNF